MGHLERPESIAKSLGTFKNEEHTNGALCSAAHLAPRRQVMERVLPGKDDSTRSCEQMP